MGYERLADATKKALERALYEKQLVGSCGNAGRGPSANHCDVLQGCSRRLLRPLDGRQIAQGAVKRKFIP